jgi:SAM-dependent methyltransferase
MKEESSIKKERIEVEDRGSAFFSEKAMTIDRKQMLMVVEESIDFVRGPRVLEMGYTDRGWTDALIGRGFKTTVVEGSSYNVNYAREKYGASLEIYQALFEEFIPRDQYDTVLMSCILEHVIDPVALLQKAKDWLRADGRIVIVVPNKISLHRRIGLEMNLIKTYEDFSPQDIEVGHRRHYTIEDMLSDITISGLTGRFEKGIFLKPLSSSQMKDWSDPLLMALNKVGRFLPEWSAFLLFVAYISS